MVTTIGWLAPTDTSQLNITMSIISVINNEYNLTIWLVTCIKCMMCYGIQIANFEY